MIELEKVDSILEKYNKEPSLIIAMLQDIQAQVNYLPEDALIHVAKNIAIPLSRIYRLASFYKAFSLKPRGKHVITVCVGTTCHVKGAPTIVDTLERKLGIKVGETTEDMNFTLETIICLGCCGLAPVVKIDKEIHSKITSAKIRKIIEQYK